MSARAVPEWRGKTPETRVPPRVRVRIFEAHDGRCALSGRKIMPGDAWDLDHKVALVNGGEHREENLQPVLRDKHREKTKADVAEKAKVAAVRARHLGVKPAPARKIQSPGFPKAPKRREVGPKEMQMRALRERMTEGR